MRPIHALGLSSFVLLAACADVTGGADEAVHRVAQGDSADDCAPDDKACAEPAPGACNDVVYGDGETCRSYVDIKTDATTACSTAGGGLTDIKIDPEDQEGCVDGARAVTYTCCLAPEAPEGPVCTGDVVGDGTACISAADIHDEAAALCAAAGTELTQIWPGDSCAGGGATIAKYVCCAP